MSATVGQLKQRARRLKAEIHALYLACRDPRVPWYAKVVVACVVGYALSPIDLIPDFIPVLGYLDDLILVPAGIMLALRLIPSAVMDVCREKAGAALQDRKPKSWVAAGIIVFAWLVAAVWGVSILMRFLP